MFVMTLGAKIDVVRTLRSARYLFLHGTFFDTGDATLVRKKTYRTSIVD